MTLDDFLYYCVDAGMLKVEVYDCEAGEVVFRGYGDEVPDDILYEELSSFDIPSQPDMLTLNIR